MIGNIIHDLPRYARYRRARGGLEIGYPWLTVGAMCTLDAYVLNQERPAVIRHESDQQRADRVPRRVLELGSGGSTVFFARRVEHVRSYETNPAWAELTTAGLARAGLAEKVTLVSCPLVDAYADVSALPDSSFDLLLVDHDDPTVKRHRERIDRLPLAKCALPKLRPGGWIVVDNYAMHGMEHFDYADWTVRRFDDFGYMGMGTIIAKRKA